MEKRESIGGGPSAGRQGEKLLAYDLYGENTRAVFWSAHGLINKREGYSETALSNKAIPNQNQSKLKSPSC